MADAEPTRLEGHLNAAEFWLRQADNYNFPNPARTECIQLAQVHATLADALARTGPPATIVRFDGTLTEEAMEEFRARLSEVARNRPQQAFRP